MGAEAGGTRARGLRAPRGGVAVTQTQLELDTDGAAGDDVTTDDAARAAILERCDATLFVEAGSGSGKTSSLVGRVVALVTQRGVPMREIVAVTFTEKAAA